MALDPDDEILQDFLVEGGEILELLGEQLVDLEQRPADAELLNAVFRGFHTIKGGASFVSLDNMVEVCHVAEDVFNLLRQGEKQVDSHLMDVMLQVLDVVNDMFDSVRGGREPEPASAQLITELKSLQKKDSAPPPPTAPAPQTDVAPVAKKSPTETVGPSGDEGDISDDEFERLLDALDESETDVTQVLETSNDATQELDADEEISDDEFEALLDDLHGKGQHGGTPQGESVASTAPASSPSQSSFEDEEITEQEFEALLDNLHGSGKHGGVPQAAIEEQEAQRSQSASAGSDDITEEEFEKLLDDLHGQGQFKAAPVSTATTSTPTPTPTPTPVAAVAPEKPTVVEQVAVAEKPVTAAPAPAQEPVTNAAGNKDVKAKTGKDTQGGESTVRVDTKRLDDIMNMVGELVLVRNRLVTLESALGNEDIAQAIGNLDLVTADLQTAVMKTRMQPIKKVFGRFPRVVRDLARSLRKEVNLELQGEDTDLDKNLVEALADPLVHLVRNAVDHGIEMPDIRQAAGKQRAGTVLLAAEQEGDHILLTISDDGGGMDANVLRDKAVEKGLMDKDNAARLSDKDAYNLIFAPGFSTKDEISDISGRGVGMDVVKTRIVQLNGVIDIESELGKGTRLSIKVPLTLAIMPTLMVMLDTQIFALPLVSVSEIFNLDLTNTNLVDGQPVIMLREKPLPLYYLKDWLVHMDEPEPHPDQGHVV
ncbi:MAG: chemotaxis protein CheA, partial [Gammaproteobacteria bacterium]|nr:chemotaxis protein CheA [Gammaproteobacteria bacterium]